jgi:hypothetical protein
MVLVSLFAFFPVLGSITSNHSVALASGDSPVPDGLNSFIGGSASGSSSASKQRIVPSSYFKIGNGSPQYL